MAYFRGCNVNIYWQYNEEMAVGWVCYRHSVKAKATAPAVLIQQFINNSSTMSIGTIVRQLWTFRSDYLTVFVQN